ncbi:protein translocase subunit SecF [Moritella sp. F3]|uniref:protein translocase subunit SecF n=1 Tax=Moritella sp. F3 TaxID=2718882 RepID=UPI0018E1B0AA|nr:protein translocase subunit SecF [Moritella sp. F3]GIC78059.1 protein-export membrane protein SecF [Moritella sp. F1]GIC82540.1 protein-export membrane protein SecF [Moritella sp. F3]
MMTINMRKFNNSNKYSRLRYFSSAISVVFMLISMAFISINGLNWGLDFTGGVITEVQLDPSITMSEISPLLQSALDQNVSVIEGGEVGRWILRYAEPAAGVSIANMSDVLAPLGTNIEVLNTSIVGSQVGAELAEQGGLALLVSMLCIMAYLSYRFEWRLASGALFALVHDVLFVLGVFAALQLEFNLTVFAAILAIIGYSLNDSIIIGDRIRELLILKPTLAIADANNQAIAATISRTMVTSGTTLMTVSALWLLGGGPLDGFSTAMFIGLIVGTWSSIAVATTLPEFWGLNGSHYQIVELTEEFGEG